MSRPRILFLSNDLKPQRGGHMVACWMLQGLADAYDVTVLSWDPPDWNAVDRRFNTSLSRYGLPVLLPGPVERRLIGCIPDPSQLQAINYLLRRVKQLRRQYDVVVASASMECDFGAPGIQYIHYPYLGFRPELFDMPGDTPWPARLGAVATGRLAPWMAISGYSFARMRRNYTLVNSHWSVDLIRRVFDIEAHVLYPPADSAPDALPWAARENAFVALGAFEDGKRQDFIIETLAEVRRLHPGIRLHLCGGRNRSEYAAGIEALARRHAGWVELHYDLPAAELMHLIGRQKYGFHGMIEEHFGIAPATFAASGCIPFLHDSGGQVEIVNREPHVCYRSREDAVRKVLGVIADDELQCDLQRQILAASQRFTTSAFMEGARRHVERFLAQRPHS